MSEPVPREWRFFIDNDILWSIVEGDVPELLQALIAFKNRL